MNSDYPSMELRGIDQTMKNTQTITPPSTKCFICHYALKQAGSPIRQIWIHPSDCQTVKFASSLPRMYFHCSKALYQLNRCLMLHKATQQWKLPQRSRWRILLLMVVPEQCGTPQLLSQLKKGDFSVPHAFCGPAISLCGRPVHGWAVDGPWCFHFTIIKVWGEGSNRATDLLRPMVMPWS